MEGIMMVMEPSHNQASPAPAEKKRKFVDWLERTFTEPADVDASAEIKGRAMMRWLGWFMLFMTLLQIVLVVRKFLRGEPIYGHVAYIVAFLAYSLQLTGVKRSWTSGYYLIFGVGMSIYFLSQLVWY
jgi:hypothetical protein